MLLLPPQQILGSPIMLQYLLVSPTNFTELVCIQRSSRNPPLPTTQTCIPKRLQTTSSRSQCLLPGQHFFIQTSDKCLSIEYLLENSLSNFGAIVSLFQTLQFPEAFLSAPTIIVSAAHTKTSLNMPPEYNSIVTWVEVITSQTTH